MPGVLKLEVHRLLLRFLAIVRLHRDYAAQFWFLYYKIDTELVESRQKRLEKIVDSMRSFTYEKRLKLLNLYTH